MDPCLAQLGRELSHVRDPSRRGIANEHVDLAPVERLGTRPDLSGGSAPAPDVVGIPSSVRKRSKPVDDEF